MRRFGYVDSSPSAFPRFLSFTSPMTRIYTTHFMDAVLQRRAISTDGIKSLRALSTSTGFEDIQSDSLAQSDHYNKVAKHALRGARHPFVNNPPKSANISRYTTQEGPPVGYSINKCQ